MENFPQANCAPTGPAGPRNYVLLVEDDENIARLLEIYLDRLGLAACCCQFGNQALELFFRNPAAVRLVVADCRLPDLDGREMCHRMRTVRPELPVLLASGNVAVRNLAPVLPGPGVEFLAKPYSPAEFSACVRSMLAGPVQDSVAASAGFV